MEEKRILTVQDLSCVGKCSLTLALPILSACGLETAVLPTAVLSTHTGGFTAPARWDVDIPAIAAHWAREGVRFDAVCTGYLGSRDHIGPAADILRERTVPGGVKIVDPAMGDGGRLYSGFDRTYVEEMRALCGCGDILLPNLTEAFFLADEPVREDPTETELSRLLEKLGSLGPRCVVLTGVSPAPGRFGAAVWNEGRLSFQSHEKIPGHFHGTGDAFAACFAGALMRGGSVEEAAALAGDFTADCVRNTVGRAEPRYGLRFEGALSGLIKRLNGI